MGVALLKPVIEVRDCWFKYRGSLKWALKGVSLDIEEGSFNLVVGPTGSGKTTLLRLFNGLIPCFYRGEFRGSVKVYGIDTRSASVAQLSKYVGMVSQEPENQLLTFSVESEVAFGLENMGLRPSEILSKVNSLLKELGLEKLKHKVPYELSRGEMLKVAIASVLALDPSVIVLDEPTSTLEPLTAVDLMNLLNYLRMKRGKTIVISEHRVEYVLPFVDNLIVLSDGRAVTYRDVRSFVNKGVLSVVDVDEPALITLFKALKDSGYCSRIPLSIEEAIEVLRGVLNC